MTPSLGPYGAFLFDKDGTLVDAFDGWVTLVRALHADLVDWYGAAPLDGEGERALGIEGASVSVGGVIASGTEDELFAVLYHLAGPGAPGWTEFRSRIAARAVERFAASPPAVRPLGRVRETLAALKARGILLGVATSDTYPNANRDLGPHGAELFDFWATTDRVSHPKPHPESIHAFCQALGLKPEQVVFVGDSRVDLEAARAAGVGRFVAVRSQTCPPEVVDGADASVFTVEDLLKLNFQ